MKVPIELRYQLREWALNTASGIEAMQEDQHPDRDRITYLRGSLAALNEVLVYIGEESIHVPIPVPPPARRSGIDQYQAEDR